MAGVPGEGRQFPQTWLGINKISIKIKGTLPPSKKLINSHKNDVPWFRKIKNENLPNIEKESETFGAAAFVLKRWNHLNCVPDDHTDRLICYISFPDQVMTLTLTQVRFSPWFLRSNHSFDASWRKKHNAGKMNIVSSCVKTQKLLLKKSFCS